MAITLLKCPSKLHTDGLAAELAANGYKAMHCSDKEIIVETDYSDEFCNMTVRHCAFMTDLRDMLSDAKIKTLKEMK